MCESCGVLLFVCEKVAVKVSRMLLRYQCACVCESCGMLLFVCEEVAGMLLMYQCACVFESVWSAAV